MTYDIKLKANKEIFEKNRFIPVGQHVILTPVDINSIEKESMFYLINSQNDAVKTYLPKIYAETPEEAKEKLIDFAVQFQFKCSLFYCIKTIKEGYPIGYIQMNTPLAPMGLECWNVVFWLGKIFQGRGVMTISLYHLLVYLQQFGVLEVKALVHSENIKSIKILENLNFGFVHQEQGGEKRFLYKIRLD